MHGATIKNETLHFYFPVCTVHFFRVYYPEQNYCIFVGVDNKLYIYTCFWSSNIMKQAESRAQQTPGRMSIHEQTS